MTKISVDSNLVSYCGLYCAACKKYLTQKCPGCHKNEKASWCKVRKCCMENDYKSCADCKEFSNPADCKMYNNFMSKLFGFIFRSDRDACIALIKESGYEEFSKKMAADKRVTIKR